MLATSPTSSPSSAEATDVAVPAPAGALVRVTKKGTIALLSFDDAARALAQEGFVASSKNHFKKSVRQRQKQHLRDAQRALVTPPAPARRDRRPDLPECNVTVVFDCTYGDLMSDKQLRSFADQIKTAYGVLRTREQPVMRLVCCGDGIGPHLDDAHKRWTNFEVTAGQFHEEPLFGGRPIWYLSADAAEVLPEELPADGVVLVVGGLVDRNRHKGITSARAARLGIEQRKLPFDGIALKSSQVLTCDTIVSILARKVYGKQRWHDAIVESLPKRKVA